MADGDQRCRAACLQSEARAAEIQLVGNAGGENIRAVAQHFQVIANLIAAGELLDEAIIGAQARQKVGGHAATGVHPDGTRVSKGIVGCIFERLPTALEKKAMLRIHQLCFARVNAEKVSVEQVHIGQNGTSTHVSGALGKLVCPGNFQLFNLKM